MAEASSSSDFLVKELVQQSEALRNENNQLHERVSHLERELAAKDNEKNMALKKQQAVIKELKKMVQEEKRRAETLERRDGVSPSSLLMGDTAASYRARSLTDGQESVSSVSMLESDNIDLINRLTDLQKVYGDSLHKISQLESANLQLERENREKHEVIEEWVRSRPLPSLSSPHSASSNSSSRGLAGFRRLIGMGESSSTQQNDVMEMNKKLQRLLEETLSKNLILQRDLQTLLERTEM